MTKKIYDSYDKGKSEVRARAIAMQIDFSQRDVSYDEIIEAQAELYKLARKYGMVRELKENGIL